MLDLDFNSNQNDPPKEYVYMEFSPVKSIN